jgi:RNA polymerase sigma-70 factor (ECF subfamily)
MELMSGFAGEELLESYGKVRAFLRRWTKDDVADDLTQQVFVEAARRLPSGEFDSELGLLYTIARRRLIDELRRSDRVVVVSPGDLSESIESLNYRPELRSALGVAIDRLGRRQREVLILKLIRGLSFAEVAAATGSSVGACKMRFGRALANVRRELEKEGIEP